MEKNVVHSFLTLFFVSVLFVLSCVLSGCKEKINVSDINGSAQVKTTLSSPIVTVETTMANFLGIDIYDGEGKSKEISKIYANIGPKDEQLPQEVPYGTLYFRDTFPITRDFHPIEISQYIRPADVRLNVFEQVAAILGVPMPPEPLLSTVTIPIPEGIDLPLSFNMTLHMSGVNTEDVTDRIDSMIISEAKFRSRLETTFGLSADEFEKVEIVLPKQFTRQGEPMGTLQITPLNVKNEDIYIDVENFEMTLQDGLATPNNRRQHMIDSLDFVVNFTIHTNQAHTIDYLSNIHYNFFVELLDFEALFGYFEPSTYMEDSDIQDLAEEWEGWNDIKQLKMRFIYPSIRLMAEHQIGTEPSFPLNVNVKGIWVASKNEDGSLGEKKYAMFGENGDSRSTIWELDELGQSARSRIDPIKDPLSKVAHNEYIVGYTGFDPKTHRGDVDKLFDLRPDVIGYDYYITVGRDGDRAALETQARLVKNTFIDLKAVTVVPFVCAEGSVFEYADTIDIDFASISIDSLIQQNNWLDTIVDGNAYIFIYAQNQIPFDINLTYELLDKDNNPVYLPLMAETPTDNKSYQTQVPAPTEYDREHKATNYGESTVVLYTTREEYDKLRNVVKLRFTASFANNPQTATIWYDSHLDVKVGVTTNLHALINLNK